MASSNPLFSSPLPLFSRRPHAPPLQTLTFSTKSTPDDSNPPTTDAPTPETFEDRLSQVRLRYRSGTGKKADVRKSKKSGKKTNGSSSGSNLYLPPVPLKEPTSGGLKVEFGFSPYSERVNGRVAALGLAALVLVELATGESVIKYHTPSIIFIQVYFVAAVTAVYCKVEKEKQLAPDNLLPSISSLLGEDVGNVAKLALVILMHQKLGHTSEWVPYISRLPLVEELHSTVLQFLTTSPEYFQDVTLHEFKHAYNLDFFNHDSFSETDVYSNGFSQFSEVIADENYAHGHEVLIRYGKFSNVRLLLDFGFILPIKYDQVLVEVNVPQHDHLHTTPSLKDVHNLISQGKDIL